MQVQPSASTSVGPDPAAPFTAHASASEQPSPGEQPSFHPEKAAFISPSQLPIVGAPAGPPPPAHALPGRSNVLYAVIALLAELDDSSLNIVQAEVR